MMFRVYYISPLENTKLTLKFQKRENTFSYLTEKGRKEETE